MAVQVEQAIAEKKHKSQSIVGLDLGIVKFVTTVTEKTAKQYDPKNTYRYLEKKLVKEQKKLKNKEKHSENWKRQIRRIQKVHQKIANSRNDFLHKLSTEISKNHAINVMEDLKVSNMSKSSKGTVMQPGRNVRAKSSLNKSILDQGWHQFKQQLKYKSQWQGGNLILVEAKYTSQKCCICGSTRKDNRKSQTAFRCIQCGMEENADINAARNILAAGHAATVCEANRISGQQQKPVETCELSLP